MSLRDGLRRPGNTGDRRCWPCTVVNVSFVLVAALLLSFWNRYVGVAAGIVGMTLVYLRGYVLPFTPTFAPKIAAAAPIPDDWFHSTRQTEPVDTGQMGGLGDEETYEGEELLGVLADVGAVSVSGEAVELDEYFATAWDDEMARLARLDTEALSDAVSEVAHAAEVFVYEEETVITVAAREWIVVSDGSREFEGETWLTRPVAIAETGAMHALDDILPSDDVRRAAAGSLRMFLQNCPDCGSELVETTNEACCGSRTNPREEPDPVLACKECGVHLYTFAE